ncbi:MAG: TonB-dependent receptor [Pseudomonadota bacterium]
MFDMRIFRLAFCMVFCLNLIIPPMASAQATSEMLAMSLDELLDMKITTAGKKEERVNAIPASVVVVTREEIERYGYSTLPEILEGVPGLYNINDYAYRGAFGSRGFCTLTPNRNLVILVNGVKQVQDYDKGNSFYATNVPVDAIDRIEVIRGPMSVMYGSGAFYGAINIITNQKELSSASVAYGSEETHKIFVRSAGSEDRFRYSMNASAYDSQGIDEPYSKMGSRGDISRAGVDETSGGRFEDQRRYFDFSGKFGDFYTDISYNESSPELAFLHQPMAGGEGTQSRVTMPRVSFGFRKEVSSSVTFDWRLDYNDYCMATDYAILPDLYLSQTERSNSYETEFVTFFAPTETFELMAGLNYRASEASNSINRAWRVYPFSGFSEYQDNSNSPIETQAFFVQTKYYPVDKLLLVAGVRLEEQSPYNVEQEGVGYNLPPIYNKYEYDYDDISYAPNIASIYSFNEFNILKLLYGEATNRPSFFDISSTCARLEPEKIQTYEANYIGTYSYVWTSFSLFHNHMSNLLVRDIAAVEEWSNEGEMATNGVEFQVQVRPLDSLVFDVAATYQDVEDKNNEDQTTAYSPKLLGYVKTAYSITHDITLALIGNYVDEMESDLLQVSLAESYKTKVDSYFTMGLNLRVENIVWDDTFLNLHVANLLNEDIFYPPTEHSMWARNGTLASGISCMATVGWNY